jgi:hypothetical protein
LADLDGTSTPTEFDVVLRFMSQQMPAPVVSSRSLPFAGALSRSTSADSMSRTKKKQTNSEVQEDGYVEDLPPPSENGSVDNDETGDQKEHINGNSERRDALHDDDDDDAFVAYSEERKLGYDDNDGASFKQSRTMDRGSSTTATTTTSTTALTTTTTATERRPLMLDPYTEDADDGKQEQAPPPSVSTPSTNASTLSPPSSSPRPQRQQSQRLSTDLMYARLLLDEHPMYSYNNLVSGSNTFQETEILLQVLQEAANECGAKQLINLVLRAAEQYDVKLHRRLEAYISRGVQAANIYSTAMVGSKEPPERYHWTKRFRLANEQIRREESEDSKSIKGITQLLAVHRDFVTTAKT